MKKVVLALTGVVLAGFIGSARAADTGNAGNVEAIQMSASSDARSYQLVQKLYSPFLTRHPDTKVLTAVVDLGGHNGKSVVARFVSSLTCSDDHDRCMTTVLRYDSPHQTWKEVLSHHSRGLWVGPVSPLETGQGVREVITSDGIAWRWTTLGHYIPEITSVGTLFPQMKKASETLRETIIRDEPAFDVPGVTIHVSSPVLSPMMKTELAVIESPYLCGQTGCPFLLMTGSDQAGYNVMAQGVFSERAAVMKSQSEGVNDFVVQVGDDLDFYRFDSGKFRLVKTTYPSKATPLP